MTARNVQFVNAATNAATGEEEDAEHRFLTVHEVAKLLQVPVSWVYGRLRERSTEPLPGYRVGKYWRNRCLGQVSQARLACGLTCGLH